MNSLNVIAIEYQSRMLLKFTMKIKSQNHNNNNKMVKTTFNYEVDVTNFTLITHRMSMSLTDWQVSERENCSLCDCVYISCVVCVLDTIVVYYTLFYV